MNLNNVFDEQDYLYLYDKTKGFDAKKSFNAISTSLLEKNVFWYKKKCPGA